MKTKITTLLMVFIFFLSISAFADDNKPAKAKILPDCGCGDEFDDDKNVIDYARPPWWIGPPEMLPDID